MDIQQGTEEGERKRNSVADKSKAWLKKLVLADWFFAAYMAGSFVFFVVCLYVGLRNSTLTQIYKILLKKMVKNGDDCDV